MEQNTTDFGVLKPDIWLRQKAMISAFGRARAFLEFDERAGHLAPFAVRLCHHGGEQHGGMLVEHVLDLDRRDVLATGDKMMMSLDRSLMMT